MLENLLVVIHHYDKHLFDDMKAIKDPRCQSYITYPLEVMVIVRILAYCCHIQSMAEMNDDFNSENAIRNVSKICGVQLSSLPHGDTINDLFKRLNIDGLRTFLTTIVKRMIRSRFFENCRFQNTYYQLVIDGTQFYLFDKKHIEKSLTRTHEDGSKTYHTQSLTAYLMVGEKLMVPVDFEMIENEKEDTSKQDCELKAAKRLLARIKRNYPRLQILLSADALYANKTIMRICREYNWRYIIRFKRGRIGTLMEEFDEHKAGNYAETFTEKIVKHKQRLIERNYSYVNGLNHEGNRLSLIELCIKEKEKTTNFHFITDMEITKKNAGTIVSTGRKRWKIENKGFNDEKNHGYGLGHAYSYDSNAIKCHYVFLLISHLFMQLLEHYLETKDEKEKIKTIGKEIKEAFRQIVLNANGRIGNPKPIQVRKEISY